MGGQAGTWDRASSQDALRLEAPAALPHLLAKGLVPILDAPNGGARAVGTGGQGLGAHACSWEKTSQAQPA